MPASRKLYQEIATTLGRIKRVLGATRMALEDAGVPQATLEVNQVLETVERDIIAALRADNAAFNEARFRQWMTEVEKGERSQFTGKVLPFKKEG